MSFFYSSERITIVCCTCSFPSIVACSRGCVDGLVSPRLCAGLPRSRYSAAPTDHGVERWAICILPPPEYVRNSTVLAFVAVLVFAVAGTRWFSDPLLRRCATHCRVSIGVFSCKRDSIIRSSEHAASRAFRSRRSSHGYTYLNCKISCCRFPPASCWQHLLRCLLLLLLATPFVSFLLAGSPSAKSHRSQASSAGGAPTPSSLSRGNSAANASSSTAASTTAGVAGAAGATSPGDDRCELCALQVRRAHSACNQFFPHPLCCRSFNLERLHVSHWKIDFATMVALEETARFCKSLTTITLSVRVQRCACVLPPELIAPRLPCAPSILFG